MESLTTRTSEQSLLASSSSLPDFGTKEFFKKRFHLNGSSEWQELLLEYEIRGNPVLDQIGKPPSNEEADLEGGFASPNFKELQLLGRVGSLCGHGNTLSS